MEDLISVGKECVRKAVEAVRNSQNGIIDERANIKTKSDFIAQDAIIEVLREKKFPVLLYSEEFEEPLKLSDGPKYTFVIDPLDGSYWHLKGNPEFCSSALLVLKDNEPIAAFVASLVNDDIYHCDEEKAYKNDVEIKIPRKIISKPIIAMWASYGEAFKNELPKLNGLADTCRIFTRCGQFLKVYSGEGRVDATIETKEIGLHELAGTLIAQRAGAIVSRLDGAPIVWDPKIKQTSVTAVNRELHSQILSSFK